MKRKLNLPKMNLKSDYSLKAKEKWRPLALESADGDINILDEIGDDWWSDSDTTLSRVQRKLSAAGGEDITVNINSFGGDLFEGIAIYNALAAYPGKITVKILGIAASAASVIAMAGDEIKMSEASFLMIHNSWVIAAGNRNDFLALAEELQPFDNAMASLYASRTGLDKEEIIQLMDKETYISGEEALDHGFATSLINDKEYALADDSVIAAHRVDRLLAKQNIPRSERRRLLKEIKEGTQNAAPESTHNAAQRSQILTKMREIEALFIA